MVRFALLLALLLGNCLSVHGATSLLYNVTEIPGPFETSPGAPEYVPIKKFTARQLGQYVQFVWEAAGNWQDNKDQYYFIVLDTDRDPQTGQYWGGVGGEIKFIVTRGGAAMHTFNAQGDWIDQVNNLDVAFQDSSFCLNVEKAQLPDHFDLYFESSGGTPYFCRGVKKEIALQPAQGAVSVMTTADEMVLSERPALINLPTKAATAQLKTYLVQDGVSTSVPADQVTYSVTHPVTHRPDLGDPAAIISVDAHGVARYLKEGYVFVRGAIPAYGLASDRVIVATGQVYGDPRVDNVLAVFPADYKPADGRYTFADMLASHPNYMGTVNLAYRVTSSLYGGFLPYAGDRQIFALLVLPDLAGGAGNPLETAPVGYMNFGDGTPQYNLVIHELGHNFSDATGMRRLLEVKNYRFALNGFGEGVASLPVIYLASEIYHRPEKYGISKSSREWSYYRDFLAADKVSAANVLTKFESLIQSGTTKGIFDNQGAFDDVAVFCSFFQSYSFGFTKDENPYGNEVIRRFLGLFGDHELPNFDADGVETYFCAAFSVAVGVDVKQKLRGWGFTIDDAYYDQLRAELAARVPQDGGALIIAPVITAQTQAQAASLGGAVSLSVMATGAPIPSYQWHRNGLSIAGATSTTLEIAAVQPLDAGCYTASVFNGATAATDPVIVGVTTTESVVGDAEVKGTDILHPNGNVFDQVLLTGAAEAIRAYPGKVTRTSFIDLNHDIVQVEFSGAGTLSLVLDGAAPPAPPVNYNQAVDYVRGHAGIVIVGADATTNVSVFTVGRATAFDPTGRFNMLAAISETNDPADNGSSLFAGHTDTAYDGVADIAFIAIQSVDGKFGGLRTANARYFAVRGLTGVYAPGIDFSGPVYIGDIDAHEAATPVIKVGSAGNARITGGDLSQSNGQPVQVSGLSQLRFTSGGDSGGNLIEAKTNQAVLQQDGVDVTSLLVVGPGN